MKNSLILLAVALSVAAFAGMMRIKTDVQTMDRMRLQLVRERAELRETKRVLEAEWALLASPARMERLVRGKDYVPATALDVVAPVLTSAELVALTPTPTAVVSPTVGAEAISSATATVSPVAAVSPVLVGVVVSVTEETWLGDH